MEKTTTFEDLIVWKKAHQFVLMIYSLTKKLPKEEQFGLVSQFRRAAVSIPSNIAEGYKKIGKKDKLRFFNIAQGSIEECRYYLILVKDLGYVENTITEREALIEVSKLLNAYCKSLMKAITT